MSVSLLWVLSLFFTCLCWRLRRPALDIFDACWCLWRLTSSMSTVSKRCLLTFSECRYRRYRHWYQQALRWHQRCLADGRHRRCQQSKIAASVTLTSSMLTAKGISRCLRCPALGMSRLGLRLATCESTLDIFDKNRKANATDVSNHQHSKKARP